MLAVVVAGGELLLSERAIATARAADLLIAVDSGARHLPALHRGADLLIGDFDSYRPSEDDGEILRFPTAKDQTDTHLAVREARSRGAERITLLAAMRGPRLDHGAANLLLLSAREFERLELTAIDGQDELQAVRRSRVLNGRAGNLVSLLALTATVRGVTTHGLAYPLAGATLRRGETRGVSNVMLGARAAVSLTAGLLLLIHRDGDDPNRIS